MVFPKLLLKTAFYSVVFFCFIFVMHGQSFAEVKYTFSAFVGIQTEYDDNIFLDRSRKSDLITTIYPGFNLSLYTQRSSLNLIYTPGIVEFRDHSEFDYVSQSFSITGDYALSEHLRLDFTDDFIRTEDPRIDEIIGYEDVEEQLREVTTRFRSTRNRNTFQPRLTYQFGRENYLRLNYRNTIYKDEDPTEDDYTEHFINSELDYWFNVKNGITLTYSHLVGEFDIDADIDSDTIIGRYTHRLTPHFELFGEYGFRTFDFEDNDVGEDDYDVHEANLGFRYQYSPYLDFEGYAGYFIRKEARQDDEDGYNFSIGTFINKKHLLFNFIISGGYYQDYFVSGESGYSEYWGITSNILYDVTQKIHLNARGSYFDRDYKGERVEGGNRDRKDNIYRFHTSIIYDFARFASFEVRYIHEENDSNRESEYYINNRIMAMITLYKNWSNRAVTASPVIRRHMYNARRGTYE